MAACWATQYNMLTRIIDQKEGRTKTGHGDGFQSRTLDILDSFGLAEDILRQATTECESSYWLSDKQAGNLHRVRTEKASHAQDSRYSQALLNQGSTEQVLIDYLEQKQHIHVERSKQAETLRTEHSKDRETINARYLLACDGAHSWTRNQLDIPTEGDSKGSTWGICDIVPITDFPDIRRSCAINAEGVGSIMTVPRENRLVRFYTLLQESEKEKIANSSSDQPSALVDIAARAMKPYSLSYKHCDWWSLYTVRRRLTQNYRPHDRVFLLGDAAHSHSPLGGQGMNVSIQDSYNLVWKIGAVVSGVFHPKILDTYQSERRPVGEKLMELDKLLAQAYEKAAQGQEKGVAEICSEYSGFMSGIKLTYPESVLINQGGTGKAIARHIKPGMRIDSVSVIIHADGIGRQLARSLASCGFWRLLVFPGDLRRQERTDRIKEFAEAFSKCHSLASVNQAISKKTGCPILDLILIHSGPTTAFDLLDLPHMFHRFDDKLGWDYWKVFADDKTDSSDVGKAYGKYGIDENGPCCLVLCRPDQHVAWAGDSADIASLDAFFSCILH